MPDPGATLAHSESLRIVHWQFPAAVRLNANEPPREFTWPGMPVAVVLQVDGLGDGEGVGEGEFGDGEPFSSLPHATTSSNSVSGASRREADRIIARLSDA